MAQRNPFELYTSKVPRIHIPLPAYRFYHKASDENEVDRKFIGRKQLSKKLRNWLSEGSSGSYLITGYRGMGKSSFVGKVLNEISFLPRTSWNIIFYLSVLFGILGCIQIVIPIHITFLFSFAISLAFCGLNYLQEYRTRKKQIEEITDRMAANAPQASTKDSGTVPSKLAQKNLLIAKINLGHEILNERDILCLISKNIHRIYTDYLKNPQTHLTYSYLFWLLVFILSVSIGLGFSCSFEKISSDLSITFKNACLRNLFQLLKNSPLIHATLFTGLLFLIRYLLRYFLYKITGTEENVCGLERLNDRIDASVNEDKGPAGVVSTSVFGININRKRNKLFPQASIREIESELLIILNRISKSLFLKPKFIIVFDELDKIDPATNYATPPSENIPEFRNNVSGFPEGAASRKRKQNVLNLLANMKLFVSSSNAKFIFISGRELYDAFLADLSDREFAISSIFNGVLYVDSFLSSDKNLRDVSSMTETYICKQLIPDEFLQRKREEYRKKGKMEPDTNLKLYYDYLTEGSALNENKNDNINQSQHIIILLYHFSVYLSHICNGSPKKISLYFEQYIEEKEDINPQELKAIQIDQANSRYYLSFGYTDQRKIGFIHYIAFPAVQSIINRASQYGDKLLVSASFLMDHIYKYHNHGFSWRNLEYTPELLEVYRTPELRKFIESIVSSLKQTHLIPISCGLYQLKFRKKISEEISMFSKFSEEISAIFNFTLDESLSVKKHYFALLEEYEKSKERDYSMQSLASIHHILGDLHMSDEEYNEAIFEYQKSLHLLSHSRFSPKYRMANTLSLIRTILKLGLTYELRHTYNSAYVIYSELVNHLIDYRYLDEKKLHIRYVQLENDDRWFNKEAVLYCPQKTACEEAETNSCHWSPRLVKKLGELDDLGYYTKGENILTDMALQINPEVGSLLLKLSLFEDIRLIYQALLAKLFVIEKIELGGITRNDLKIVEAEYAYLHLTTNEKEKYIISADFFRKLAEIMYYKNGLPYRKTDCFFQDLYFWGCDVNTDILDFCRKEKDFHLREKLDRLINDFEFTQEDYRAEENEENVKKILTDKLLKSPQAQTLSVKKFIEEERIKIIEKISIKKAQACMERRKKATGKNTYLPCYACKYYNRSLKLLAEHLFGEKGKIEETSKAVFFCRQLMNLQSAESISQASSSRSNYLADLGYSLDGMGNVQFSCADEKDAISPIFLDNFFNRTVEKQHTDWGKHIFSKLEKAIFYYWDASEAFKLASRLQESSVCLKKILSVFLNYLITNEKKDARYLFTEDDLRLIQNKIVQRALQALYSHYEYVNISEIQTIKWIFSKQMYEKIPLSYLSSFPDIEEIVLIHYELCLRWKNTVPSQNPLQAEADNLCNLYKNATLSKLRNENTVNGRIHVLKFKAFFNYDIFKQLVKNSSPNSEDKNINVIDSPNDFYHFLYNYLSTEKKWSCFLGENYKTLISGISMPAPLPSSRQKYELLEFLINDSLFCLTKIIEIVGPSNTSTLFSDTFMADVYHSLLEWNILYEDIYLLLRYYDLKQDSSTKEKEFKDILSRILRMENKHKQANKEQTKHSDEQTNEDNEKQIEDYFENKLIPMITEWNQEKAGFSEKFFQDILKNIDKSNIQYTMNNYLAEMALKKLKETQEMHSEGKAYKDMIGNMYLLDDDLNNDTCQFDFAAERYLINCGYIEKQIDTLKKNYTESVMYNIHTYVSHNQ